MTPPGPGDVPAGRTLHVLDLDGLVGRSSRSVPWRRRQGLGQVRRSVVVAYVAAGLVEGDDAVVLDDCVVIDSGSPRTAPFVCALAAPVTVVHRAGLVASALVRTAGTLVPLLRLPGPTTNATVRWSKRRMARP